MKKKQAFVYLFFVLLYLLQQSSIDPEDVGQHAPTKPSAAHDGESEHADAVPNDKVVAAVGCTLPPSSSFVPFLLLLLLQAEASNVALKLCRVAIQYKSCVLLRPASNVGLSTC